MSFATWSFTGENINNNNEAVKFEAEENWKLGASCHELIGRTDSSKFVVSLTEPRQLHVTEF